MTDPYPDDISRRDFMTRAAMVGAAVTTGLPVPARAVDATRTPAALLTRAASVGMVQAFPLGAVRLLPGMYANAAELNRKFMLAME